MNEKYKKCKAAKCKVAIMPTTENLISFGRIIQKNGKLFINHVMKNRPLKVGEKAQHIYILSDDEIKNGDWVLNPIYKTVYQWIENENIIFDRIDAKKIIATTDYSSLIGICKNPGCIINKEKTDLQFIGLNCSGCIKRGNKFLPKLSYDFLALYCENGFIDEVLVECDELMRLKVSPDNSISIILI